VGVLFGFPQPRKQRVKRLIEQSRQDRLFAGEVSVDRRATGTRNPADLVDAHAVKTPLKEQHLGSGQNLFVAGHEPLRGLARDTDPSHSRKSIQ
jgi:hypothetical protein